MTFIHEIYLLVLTDFERGIPYRLSFWEDNVVWYSTWSTGSGLENDGNRPHVSHHCIKPGYQQFRWERVSPFCFSRCQEYVCLLVFVSCSNLRFRPPPFSWCWRIREILTYLLIQVRWEGLEVYSNYLYVSPLQLRWFCLQIHSVAWVSEHRSDGSGFVTLLYSFMDC